MPKKDAKESGEELLLQFVQEALVLKSSGGRTGLYDQLVTEVRRLKLAAGAGDPDAGVALLGVLRPLTGSVSCVSTSAHEALLREALDLPLWRVAPEVRAAALDLVLHLAAAVGAAVQPCLQTLVHGLLPPPGPPAPDTLGQAWAPAPGSLQIQDEVIETLGKVLVLVPTAAPRVLPLLTEGFPHVLRDRAVHCLYVRALLRISEGPAGGLVREALLAAVVQHLLSLDVEIRWEDIVDVMTEEAREEEGGGVSEEEVDMFELEGMTAQEAEMGGRNALPGSRGGWEGGAALAPGLRRQDSSASARRLTSNGQPLRAVNEMADKLDSLMELVLEHLAARAASGGLPAAFRTLLAVFERRILHAHRSKFVQFVVFAAAARDARASGGAAGQLLDSLLGTLGDEGAAGITRTAAAAYTASFLARARFLPESQVVAALTRMLAWAQQYAASSRHAGLPRIPSGSVFQAADAAEVTHAAFHAAVQGALYVLCYHLDVLVGSFRAAAPALGAALRLNPGAPAASPGPAPASDPGEQLAWVLDAALPALLAHPLDPLSSCARSVSAEFGRQARRLRLRALAAAVSAWDARAAAARLVHRPLEVFFPFDPYLLARSAQLLDLDSTFLAWRRGQGADRVAGDSGDEEGVEDQEIDSDACTSDSGSESESDSDSSSTSDASSSDSGADEDDPKRTRFGSLPLSSGASGEQRWEPIKFVRRPRAGPPAQHPSNLPAASPILSGAMLGSSAEAAPGAFVAGASMSSDGGFGSLPATERGAAWAALRWPRDGPVPMSCTPGT
uniref:RNA polymerase I-specific transcription initiation factor RRN3 n=1 Tax=Auxenochlorella protothecoides TaxID=3075 RepID=A0A1D2AG36_AUXPR